MRLFKGRDWLPYVAMLVCAGLVLWVLVAISRQSERVDALAEALDAEQQAAVDDGRVPVAPSVEELLKNPSLRGPTGAQGVPGLGVMENGIKCVNGVLTVAYTNGAVDSNAGPCEGKTGASGAPGTNGVDGEDGKTIVGPMGLPGTNGTDGRGIAEHGVKCVDVGAEYWQWQITYTDGVTETDVGPCFDPREGPLG